MKIAAKTMFTLFFVSTAILLSAQEYGVASYYSDKFHGKSTASGETYDKDKYTAAHKTFAFGTIIKVTRLDNKKSVKVRVTDRGPYVNGRIVDLSRKAAESLDLITDGTARVKVEVVDQAPDSESTTEPVVVRPTPREIPTPAPPPTSTPEPEDQPIEQPTELVITPSPTPAPRETTPSSEPTTPSSSGTVPAPVSPSPVSLKSEMVTQQNYSQFGLYKIALEKPSQNGFAVQVASMTNYNSVMKQIAELQGNWFTNILLSVEPNASGEPVFKLLLGPFETQASANAYKASVKKKTGISGFVVNLEGIKY